MNSFEVAVLRILVKRHEPLKLSSLVGGFPDNCEDDILAAISQLKQKGYLEITEYRPSGEVCLARQRRRDVLGIVQSDLAVAISEAPAVMRPTYSAAVQQIAAGTSRSKRSIENTPIGPMAIASRSRYSNVKRIALALALVIGVTGLLVGGGLPSATSPNLRLVAYHPDAGAQTPVEQVNAHMVHNFYYNDFAYSGTHSTQHIPVIIVEVNGSQTTVLTFDAVLVQQQTHNQLLS